MNPELIIDGSIAFGAVYLLGRSVVNFFKKESKYDFYMIWEKEEKKKRSFIKEKPRTRWPINVGDEVVCVQWGKVIIGKVERNLSIYGQSYKIVFGHETYTVCGRYQTTDYDPVMMRIYDDDAINKDDVSGTRDFIHSEAEACNWKYKYKGR